MLDFIFYYGRVLRYAFNEGRSWGRDQMLALLLAAGILMWQLSTGEIHVNGDDVNAQFLPYEITFAAWAIFHLVRAPWKMDKENRELKENAQRDLQAEIAKVDKPEITGKVSHFAVKTFGSGNGEEYEWIGTTSLRCTAWLCNRRAVPTNIRSVKIDGSEIDSTLTVENILHDGAVVFNHGVATPLEIQLRFKARRDPPKIEGNWPDKKEVSLELLRIHVIDSFDQSHLIQVEDGEKVVF